MSHVLFDCERRSEIDLYFSNLTKNVEIKPTLPKGPFLVVAINSDNEDLVQVENDLHLLSKGISFLRHKTL